MTHPLLTAAYALDTALWAAEVLGMDLDPWQVRLVRAPRGARAIALVHRQAGKSTGAAVAVAHTMAHRPGSTSLALAPTLRQSSELIRKTRAHLLAAGLKLTTDAVFALETKDGARFLAMPGSDDASIRGLSIDGDLVVDEAARVSDALYAAARPMLARHADKPIRFQSFRRNEVGAKIGATTAERAMRAGTTAGLGLVVEEQRQQRAATLLVDVAYIIEAHFTLTSRAGAEDTPAKHISMFNRRAAAGQCFHRPCLGTREFAAEFNLLPDGAPLPTSELPPDQRDRDLGWMLHDIDFAAGKTSRFFRARLTDGVLDVQRCLAEGVVA